MNTILIALDFSEFSSEVEAKGYKLAQQLAAAVTLVSITTIFMEYARPDTGEVMLEAPELRQEKAGKMLQNISKAHPEVPTEILSLVGDPKKEILDTIARINPAFVVVGTHGRTGLSHFLVGSVAEYIIRHSPVPVLVVPYRTNQH